MARDTKIGMLLGLGIILLIGIFVSDWLRPIEHPPAEAATGFAGAAMDRGRATTPPPRHRLDTAAPGAGRVDLIPLAAPERRTPGDPVAVAPAGFPAPMPAWRADPAPRASGSAPASASASPSPTAEPLIVSRQVPGSVIGDPVLAARGAERSLRVRTGDTLEQLAFELYRDTGYAEALALANPHAIDTSGRPVPGAWMIVPDYAGLAAERGGTAGLAGERGGTAGLAAERGGTAGLVATRGEGSRPGVANLRIDPPAPVPPDAGFLPTAAVREVPFPPPPAPELRAPAAAPAAAPAVAREVTVEAGDSLSRLAARHLGDAQRFHEIFDANRDRLDGPDDVQVGMTLRLPAAAAAPPDAAGPRADAVAGVATYTVRPGDSLSRIAGRVLGDPDRWDELFEANRDLLGSPDRVVVGQELRVPG